MVGDDLARGRLVEVLDRFACDGPPIHALAAPERVRSANVQVCLAYLTEIFGRLGAADAPAVSAPRAARSRAR
jgi:hypothetical protein